MQYESEEKCWIIERAFNGENFSTLMPHFYDFDLEKNMKIISMKVYYHDK